MLMPKLASLSTILAFHFNNGAELFLGIQSADLPNVLNWNQRGARAGLYVVIQLLRGRSRGYAALVHLKGERPRASRFELERGSVVRWIGIPLGM